MAESSLACETPNLPCVLNCKDAKILFRFPRNEEVRRTWLERIGMNVLPLCFTLARICNNHFSESMLSEGGKRLTKCALPDINIPDKVIEKTADDNNRINTPKPVKTYLNLSRILRIAPKDEIIIAQRSRCFLKCKDAKITFAFPQDKPSFDVWAKQLGINKMPHRSSTTRICQNHFSARMFTGREGRRLNSSAIPDINLPGTTVFKNEKVFATKLMHATDPDELPELDSDDECSNTTTNEINITKTVPNLSRNDDKVTEEPFSILDLPKNITKTVVNLSQNDDELTEEPFSALGLPKPMIMEETFETFGQEILINPIENIKSVIDLPSNKEGILHVFQPGIESKDVEAQVVLPQDVLDADSECVLKCPYGERLFRFPNAESQRQLWLKKIGLTHCFHNTKICNRHFSDKMFIKSKKRLAKLAYPDINIPVPAQPRIKDGSKDLKDYKIILRGNHVCDLIDLPQYICVLTVFKGHAEIGAVVNGIKYVQHKVDDSIPKREREVQVDVADLIRTANVAIPADDYVDNFDIEENVDYKQLDWMNMFKSHVFASKADMYECLICGEISVGYACNVKHSFVHKESSSLCFQCGRLFSSQSKLKMHEKDKHLNQLKKTLRCPKMYCKKAFHSKKQLHNHVDEHTRYTVHKCFKCFRGFSSSLKLHCHLAACRNCWSLKYLRRARHDIKRRIK